MSIVCMLAGGLALVLALYAIKALVLRFIASPVAAIACFLVAVACAVPITYLLIPDWDENGIHIPRAGLLVGFPIQMLGLPAMSFLFDWAIRAQRERPGRYWRVPFEIVIGWPLWAMCSGWIMALALGWYYVP